MGFLTCFISPHCFHDNTACTYRAGYFMCMYISAYIIMFMLNFTTMLIYPNILSYAIHSAIWDICNKSKYFNVHCFAKYEYEFHKNNNLLIIGNHFKAVLLYYHYSSYSVFCNGIHVLVYANVATVCTKTFQNRVKMVWKTVYILFDMLTTRMHTSRQWHACNILQVKWVQLMLALSTQTNRWLAVLYLLSSCHLKLPPLNTQVQCQVNMLGSEVISRSKCLSFKRIIQ